jgi:hypothetical protein
MSWIESHQALRDHPKTRKLARRVGGIQQAIGILHMLWWWCIDYAKDGDLTKHDAEDIADAVAWDGEPNLLITALVESGFLDRTKKTLTVHDWMEYGGTLIAKKARDAARKREGRKAAVQGTSDGRPRDGACTDLPTYIHTNAGGRAATPKASPARVRYCNCGCELQSNGDGTSDLHCPTCEPAKVAT